MKYTSENELLASMQTTLKMYEDKIVAHKEAMASLSDGFTYTVKISVHRSATTYTPKNAISALELMKDYKDSEYGFAEVVTNNQKLVDFLNDNWGDVYGQFKE